MGAAVAARHSNDNARGQVQWGHARATAAAWIVFPVAIAPRPLRFRGHHDASTYTAVWKNHITTTV